MLSFTLRDAFVYSYKGIKPPFGFNGLGLFTYYRTYSRLKSNGENEEWFETVRRVVEGAYSLQKDHIIYHELGWNENKAQRSAQEMYDRIFNMKFLPPGRMLWALGTEIIYKKHIGQALFNCAFVSTEKLSESLTEAIKPFLFMMDMSMVGVGVGFDVSGANSIQIHTPECQQTYTYEIPDTREGWVKSLQLLLASYFNTHFDTSKIQPEVHFEYNHIREAGLPIKGFGGVSSGPEPLKEMHDLLRNLLNQYHGKKISVTLITDIMNLIGRCVIAGNVRRTAQISIGDPENEEYMKLKDYRWDEESKKYTGTNAQRSFWGWASNNSVLVNNRSDFSTLVEQTAVNGEPGYLFMDNIRNYSRMGDQPDFKDLRAKGTNPCGEQTLESYELCCLVETFPSRAESYADFMRTLKFAYLLGKTATLINTTWHETNRVQKRNRRIGTSVSGVTNFLAKHSLETLRNWLTNGYTEIQRWDQIYSSWLCVPRSIKTTSIKPSGTVSLLAGVNPGCHFPTYDYYIRRVRVAKNSKLINSLFEAGYPIEADLVDPSSVVVEFPVHNEGKNLNQISIWEQVAMVVFLQRYWSDNQVSCTITFKAEEKGMLKDVMEYNKYDLKSISFLPALDKGAFAQMPYESIDQQEYCQRVKAIKALNFVHMHEEAREEKFCDGYTCELNTIHALR